MLKKCRFHREIGVTDVNKNLNNSGSAGVLARHHCGRGRPRSHANSCNNG